MMPSASVRWISVRSASKTVSTKITRMGPRTSGRARLTAPAVPSCTRCSTNRDGIRYRLVAYASTCSFRWPVMKMSSSTPSASSRSITQSMTGRPATLRSGLGTRWVWGRRRVPLPASGMIACISHPPVPVFQPDHVIQGGRRGFQHVAVHHGLDLVDHGRPDPHRLAGPERAGVEGIAFPDPQNQLALQHMHGLVLALVILQATSLPRLHVEHLPHVAVGAGPDELVTPRLLHPVRHVGHQPSR